MIIDDGSTDKSSRICDEYRNDKRVQIYHTDNHGLSAARNLVLDHARGQYIGFVDSDDWIEPDMYEVLIDKAEETGADVVECGIYLEFADRIEEDNRTDCNLGPIDAVKALLDWKLSDTVWNK